MRGAVRRGRHSPRHSRWALSEKTKRNQPGSLHSKVLPQDSSTLLSKKRRQSSVSSLKVASGRNWEGGKGSGCRGDSPAPPLPQRLQLPPARSPTCVTFLRSTQMKKPAPRLRKGMPRARSSPAT